MFLRVPFLTVDGSEIRRSPVEGGSFFPQYLELVGDFNPFEKYYSQNGSFPQIGVKIKNVWNHQPVVGLGISEASTVGPAKIHEVYLGSRRHQGMIYNLNLGTFVCGRFWRGLKGPSFTQKIPITTPSKLTCFFCSWNIRKTHLQSRSIFQLAMLCFCWSMPEVWNQNPHRVTGWLRRTRHRAPFHGSSPLTKCHCTKSWCRGELCQRSLMERQIDANSPEVQPWNLRFNNGTLLGKSLP